MIFTIRTQVMRRLLPNHPRVLTRSPLMGDYELRRDMDSDRVYLFDVDSQSTLLDDVSFPEAALEGPCHFPRPVDVHLINFPDTKDKYGVDINIDMDANR